MSGTNARAAANEAMRAMAFPAATLALVVVESNHHAHCDSDQRRDFWPRSH